MRVLCQGKECVYPFLSPSMLNGETAQGLFSVQRNGGIYHLIQHDTLSNC